MIFARLLFANWRLIVIGLLVAALGLQTMRINNAQKQAAELRAQVAQATQLAEKQARDEENRRAESIRKVAEDANVKIKSAQADAAAARTASGRLQQRVAALVASGASTNSATAAGSPTASSTVLAELLQRMGEAAGKYAAAADESRISGNACSAAYDQLQPGEQVP